MNHDRLNLLFFGSNLHGIELCGNNALVLHLVCFTPLFFVVEVRVEVLFVVEVDLIEVLFDSDFFDVVRVDRFFFNDPAVLEDD